MNLTARFSVIVSTTIVLTVLNSSISILSILLLLEETAQAQTTLLSGANQVVEPLKPGDRIRLTVLGFADLSGEQTIGSDGTLQLPMVGAIGIRGATPTQAAQQITQALLPYVRRPQVSLSVVSVSPIHISITGEVIQPGPRLLAASTAADGLPNNAPMTLSRALILAGGITPNANLRNVVVRRQRSPQLVSSQSIAGLVHSTETTELQVDLWQGIQSGDLSTDLRLYDGDEIIVPTADAEQVNHQFLNSSIAPTNITVQVAGEVRNPGQLSLQPTAGVSGAVAAAGGLTEDARKTAIHRFRMLPNGQLEKQTFAFGTASEPLMNGDLIVVDASTRSNLGNVFDFLGRVVSPFAPLLRLFGN